MKKLILWLRSFGKCGLCKRFAKATNPIVATRSDGVKICFSCFWERLTPGDKDHLKSRYSGK